MILLVGQIYSLFKNPLSARRDNETTHKIGAQRGALSSSDNAPGSRHGKAGKDMDRWDQQWSFFGDQDK
jgi:hypothetical protein